MSFLSGLALILLTLVGYSSGAVLAGRDRQVMPGLLDLGTIVVLWVLALMSRGSLGKWLAILIWLIIACSISALLTTLRLGRYPVRKEKAHQVPRNVTGLKTLWEKWKVFAAAMGDYQGRAMLAFFYFLVITPFGLAVRLFGDPLAIHHQGQTSAWAERQPLRDELDEARKQF